MKSLNKSHKSRHKVSAAYFINTAIFYILVINQCSLIFYSYISHYSAMIEVLNTIEAFVMCLSIEYIFCKRHNVYLKYIIDNFSLNNRYFKCRKEYISYKEKQFFNSLIVINIEIFGIALSELYASIQYNSIRMFNVGILTVTIIIAFFVLILKIRFYYHKYLSKLQVNKKIRVDKNMPKNLGEIEYKEFKSIHARKKQLIILQRRKYIKIYKNNCKFYSDHGMDFNKMTDNMW